MKDDPREVGWAERHIRELEVRLKGWMVVAERADQRSAQLGQELAATDRNVDRLNERISELELNQKKLSAGLTENAVAIDAVSEELAGTDKAVVRLNERLTWQERQFNEHLDWAATHEHPHDHSKPEIKPTFQDVVELNDRARALTNGGVVTELSNADILEAQFSAQGWFVDPETGRVVMSPKAFQDLMAAAYGTSSANSPEMDITGQIRMDNR